MEDYSSNSLRSKEEILCICFLVSMYIYISIMCNVCIELFIFLLKFAISAILP